MADDRDGLLNKSKDSADKDDDPEDKHCFPYYDFVRSLYKRFDTSFINILMLENFNFGLWIMVSLAVQDLFKAYMEQEPGDMSIYSSIITLPWCFKIVFGLITDNIPLCGLKRKPYLIFWGFT